MPPEHDSATLELLIRLLRDPNAVAFSRVAQTGGHNARSGVVNCIPGDETFTAKQDRLKKAMLDLLAGGYKPNRVANAGDVEMQHDPAVFHAFVLSIERTRIYVKATIDIDDDPDDPVLRIVSVHPPSR